MNGKRANDLYRKLTRLEGLKDNEVIELFNFLKEMTDFLEENNESSVTWKYKMLMEELERIHYGRTGNSFSKD